MARELRLIESVHPWYSCAVPKPVYESPEGLAFWDVPEVLVEHTTVKANRVDARFVDHKNNPGGVLCNQTVCRVELCRAVTAFTRDV